MASLVIMDRLTQDHQIVLPGVADLQLSWELSNAGIISFSMPLRDFRESGLTLSSLKSKWIRLEHESAGTWGGQITNIDGTDGIITITGEEWASNLRGCTVEASTQFTNVAQGLVWHIDFWAPQTGITMGTINGPASPGTVGENFFDEGQDIYSSLLPSVLDYFAEGQIEETLRTPAYRVDPDTRQMSVYYAMGTDVSEKVILKDGVHNATNSGWADDLTDIVNRVKLRAQAEYSVPYTVRNKAKIRKGISTYTKTGIYLPSYNDVGPRTIMLNEDKIYPSEGAVLDAARRHAERLSRNEAAVTINCTDEDGIWKDFREGYIIGCDLGNSGRRGKFLVRTRALDMGTGVMTVSGEADLEDA